MANITKINWKEKLSSRKFWFAALTAIGGLIIAIFDVDASAINEIVGLASTVISSVAYMISESKVDAARISQSIVDVDAIATKVESILKAGGSE